jgi:type II secretory pathway pseudopilin PulG
MHVTKRLSRRMRAGGWVMYELLLATVITGALTVAALGQLAEYQKEVRATAMAESQSSFQQLAVEYYIANQTGLAAAMTDGTGAGTYCRLGVNPAAADPSTTGIQANNATKHTCAIDMALLKWKGMAPSTMIETNAYQQKWVAIFKQGTIVAPATTANVEMLTLGVATVTGIASYAPNAWFEPDVDRLMRVARKMGATGGYVPDGDKGVCVYDGTSNFQACGLQGGWKVDVSTFVN